MSYAILNLRLYVIILLALTAVIGDGLVSHSKIKVYQALFDNVTHSVIGGLSWLLVCIYCKNISSRIIVEVITCAVIASIIDLDHFLIAKSFHLEVMCCFKTVTRLNILFQDAANLKVRPPLHCSTVPIILCMFLLLISYVMNNNVILVAGLILLTAFMSHHTRDATRRGYWFYPFGSTSPIPYMSYVVITCSLPYFIYMIYKCLAVPYSWSGSFLMNEV